jgi:hypothetical protein
MTDWLAYWSPCSSINTMSLQVATLKLLDAKPARQYGGYSPFQGQLHQRHIPEVSLGRIQPQSGLDMAGWALQSWFAQLQLDDELQLGLCASSAETRAQNPRWPFAPVIYSVIRKGKPVVAAIETYKHRLWRHFSYDGASIVLLRIILENNWEGGVWKVNLYHCLVSLSLYLVSSTRWIIESSTTPFEVTGAKGNC